MDKFSDLVKKMAHETKVQLIDLCTARGIDLETGRNEFIQFFLEADKQESYLHGLKVNEDAEQKNIVDVIDKDPVLEAKSSDLHRPKVNEDAEQKNIIDVTDKDAVTEENSNDLHGQKVNEDAERRNIVDVIDKDAVVESKSKKVDMEAYEYALNNPISEVKMDLPEPGLQSQSLLLTDFTQTELPENDTQSTELDPEEKSTLLSQKLLIKHEAGGYFVVKVKYLKKVMEVVEYKEDIDVCEKGQEDEKFQMQLQRNEHSRKSFFKGEGLKAYIKKKAAQAGDIVELHHDEGAFFIAFYRPQVN